MDPPPSNSDYRTIGDNRDYIRVLLHSYYTTITGWGVLLTYVLLTYATKPYKPNEGPIVRVQETGRATGRRAP